MKKQKNGKKSKLARHARKIKFIFTSLFILAGVLFYVIFHYGFDPSLLAQLSFYENLANPSVRIVRVEPGLRKEEIAEIMADKLDWNEQEKKDFLNPPNAELALADISEGSDTEGHYFPQTYMIDKDESPSEVTATMFEEFSKQTQKIVKPTTKKSQNIISPDAALTIASIIQRESNGKDDMKLISGIIWNRIFSGMKLQMDATLQYAKGTEENGWWGQVSPADKKIDSEYNTYLHNGFPPGAIANPSLAALEAAYNPQKTDCIFYVHDKNRQIHCAKTYEEHKANIAKYY